MVKRLPTSKYSDNWRDYRDYEKLYEVFLGHRKFCQKLDYSKSWTLCLFNCSKLVGAPLHSQVQSSQKINIFALKRWLSPVTSWICHIYLDSPQTFSNKAKKHTHHKTLKLKTRIWKSYISASFACFYIQSEDLFSVENFICIFFSKYFCTRVTFRLFG